jgi:N-acyl-D-aspartate/D-glutamate deacylase
VTTVFGGFCGFSIAPLSNNSGDYLMSMLARVEGMPLPSLAGSVQWDWSSFAEFLERVEGKLAINAGFLCGHSALRRHVLGPRAVGQAASPEEIERMKALLRESIRGGALGFSTSLSKTHSDGNGDPVPSRHASIEEVLALFSVVSEFEGTLAEIAPPSSDFTDQTYELLTSASLAARRPINWNLLTTSSSSPEERARVANQLGAGSYAESRGAEVKALTLPQTPRVRLNLLSGVLFDTIPGWAPLFRLSNDDRKHAFGDPQKKAELKRGAAEVTGMLAGVANFAEMQVTEVFSAENEVYRGRLIGEIAHAERCDPFDKFLDIALADDLRTCFTISYRPDTHEMFVERARLWSHPHTVVGGGDAGAHLDMIDTFAISTELLGTGVREHRVISLEEAVHQLTLKPARFMGLKNRGKIETGWWADLVIFDADKIGAGATYTRSDLPANGMRLYADAIGIDHVIVNGREIIRDGTYLGTPAGSIIRPGVSTYTVHIPADSRDDIEHARRTPS